MIDWFSMLFKNSFNFTSFEDVVHYISCFVPFSLFASFVLSCLFYVIYELVHWGVSDGRYK